MTAEAHSVSTANRLSLPGNLHQRLPQGYYRSKLFSASFITNPLVSAASPLLSLLERLCISQTLPPLAAIRDNLHHELCAFHSRLQSQVPSEELIILASYLMSATVDELLGKSYLRTPGLPPSFTAFTPASPPGEPGPEERFFAITRFIKERPHQYLDVLELAYYCLIAGFEGKHHGQSHGRMALDNLIEDLYQSVLQHRVNKSQVLFSPKPTVNMRPKNNRILILTGLVSVGLFVLTFFSTHFLLEDKIKTLQAGYTLSGNLD